MKTPWGMTDAERHTYEWAHIDWDDEHALEKLCENRRRHGKGARLRRKARMYLRIALLLDGDWWLGRVTWRSAEKALRER